MLGMSPFGLLQFQRQRPEVKCTDFRDDTADQTTYTFTSCNLGDLGGTLTTSQSLFTGPTPRTPSRKCIVVIVHAEDDAVTFSVDSVTIGGVAGAEQVDRGGGTVALNTAIYLWTTDILADITNTDIAVTFSEAVTTCAIGVLSVEGMFNVNNTGIAAGSNQGTGVFGIGSAQNHASGWHNMLIILGSTCATGGGTETVQFSNATDGGGGWVAPMLLYSGSNAEIDYAACWTYQPQYPGDISSGVTGPNQIAVSWSGTGNGDGAQACFT